MDKTDVYALAGVAVTVCMFLGIWAIMRTKESRLYRAVQTGRLKRVQKALSKGEDIDARNELGQTALHYAVISGWFDVAECLLEHGADPCIEDKYGRTAYDLCLGINADNIDEDEEAAWRALLERLRIPGGGKPSSVT